MRNTMTIYRNLMRSAVTVAAIIALTAAKRPTPVSHIVSEPCPIALAFLCQDDDPADALYRSAREALNDGDYKKAAKMFGDVISKYPKSPVVADALYYKAFALYKIGGESNLRDALSALETEKSKYPKANTIGDANPLALRIRGALAKAGDSDAAERVSSAAQSSANCPKGGGEKDDDMRSEAMNALLQMDSYSAVPILKEILSKRDGCSAWLRKKAVFMLSQHRSNETENLMMDVIKNDPSSDVREDAVFWLGQVRSEKAESMLIDIATTARDIDLRKKALFAMTQQRMPRGQALIRKLAGDNGTPEELRKDAIWQLGQQRSQENSDALRALFMKTKGDEEIAKSVLFSLSQMRGYGNDRWLLDVALDRSASDDVRKHAIFCAGQAGISGSELIALYDKTSDRAVKEQLIWVMSDSRNATDKLIDIAKNDKDIEMRKKAIFWLGQKNDPRVRQLLIDIIKGE